VTNGARLQIEGLTITYDGDITAVDSLDLEVQPGEIVTLLGPSGSGKTSVLMAIAGFVEASAGQVRTGNEDLLALPPNQRNIGMVFQDYALFPHMTVAQNIGFPLKMRKWKSEDIDAAVDEALRMVRMTGYRDRRPPQLSGGEQQRVALARATVFDPPVLLMDEPLGALDKQLRDQLQQELVRVQRRTGITTLYVTHDQSEAMTLADRIAVMQHGRIEQIGTPAELYEHPVNRFVAEFIGESNFISGRVSQDGNRTVMELDSGHTLPLGSIENESLNSEAEVAIRPERIAIDEPGFEIQLPGLITSVSYAGEMLRFEIELDNGQQLISKQQNRGQSGVIQPGRRITASWNVDDMTVLNTSLSPVSWRVDGDEHVGWENRSGNRSGNRDRPGDCY
jgi:putative spermidine/putrescine transport system ATP-binding protein